MREGYTRGELSELLGGEPLAQNPQPRGAGGPSASIDTRTLSPGEIFFALPGERTDGHRHLEEAFQKEASFAVIRRDRTSAVAPAVPRERIVVVADTAAALEALALAHRSRFSPRVAAVTGSNGKTTTKDLLADMLGQEAPTLRTRANYNTRLGVSLTLLRLEGRHRYAVLELGISGRGEMEVLGRLARPHGAIFTNVNAAHLEGLESLEMVAREKGELLASLAEEGGVFVNGDDPILIAEMERRGAAFHTFGLGETCHIRPDRLEPWGREGLEIVVGGEAYGAPLFGEEQARNVLGAVAVARSWGISPETIRSGLSRFRPPAGRFAPTEEKGVLLVDDTYNANPASVRIALEFLARRAGGRRVLLLGDMLELGEQEEELHRAVGKEIARARLDRVLLFGCRMAWAAEAALEAGLPPDRLRHEETDREAIADDAARDLSPGDCLVVKGSRAMAMEEMLRRVRSALSGVSVEGGC